MQGPQSSERGESARENDAALLANSRLWAAGARPDAANGPPGRPAPRRRHLHLPAASRLGEAWTQTQTRKGPGNGGGAETGLGGPVAYSVLGSSPHSPEETRGARVTEVDAFASALPSRSLICLDPELKDLFSPEDGRGGG